MIVIDKVFTFIKAHTLIQLVVVFITGLALGAIFYPTKHVETKLKTSYEQQISQLKQQHSQELASSQSSLDVAKKQFTDYKSQSEDEINKLNSKMSDLKSKTKVDYYKVVKPDGTSEVHRVSESQTDDSSQVISKVQEDYKQQIDTLQKQWEDIHQQQIQALQKTWDSKEQDYQQQIKTLEQSKVLDVNKRSFGLEAGVLTDLNFYVHVTYDVVGPIFIGVQGEIGQATPALGAGVGLHF